MIIVFPAARRVGFIRNQVRTVAGYNLESRGKTLDTALSRQSAALLKMGVDRATVAEHVGELRREIEARLPPGRKQA
jgi:hypothetical protein